MHSSLAASTGRACNLHSPPPKEKINAWWWGGKRDRNEGWGCQWPAECWAPCQNGSFRHTEPEHHIRKSQSDTPQSMVTSITLQGGRSFRVSHSTSSLCTMISVIHQSSAPLEISTPPVDPMNIYTTIARPGTPRCA